MKLRNKKTGVIRDFIINKDKVQTTSAIDCWEYDSLAELNEEWEDYEESKQKEYWWINQFGHLVQVTYIRENLYDKARKNIGNYFETKEQAEQAVEKLKAWKLLKDECNIKFDGLIRDERGNVNGVKISYDRHQVTFNRAEEIMNAVFLLFGGEE